MRGGVVAATGFGRVQVVRPYQDCPTVVFGRTAARCAEFGPDSASGGQPVVIGAAAGASAESVVPRARGELVERVGNILAGRRAEARGGLVTTFAGLRRTGTAALDPAAWVGPGAAEEARHAPMLWVPGESLVTGAEVLVPAGAAFLRHRPPPGCPRVLRTGSTGVSAHVTRAAAVRHAALELLERDLLWRTWYGTSARVLGKGPQPLPPALDEIVRALGLRAHVTVLAGPAGTACVVACVSAASGREQSFGARGVILAAGVARGVETAVFEALMVRWSMGTPVARRAWQALRGDRAALPRNPLEHALLAYHRHDALSYLRTRIVPEPDTASVPAHHEPAADPEALARLLAEHTGDDVVAVDCTVAELCPDPVVRLVAPGARMLPGDERLASVPPGPDGRRPPAHPFG